MDPETLEFRFGKGKQISAADKEDVKLMIREIV